MSEQKLRVILLTHGGAESVLEQLCAVESIDVVGVFVETPRSPTRSFTEKVNRSLRYDGYLATGKKFLSIRAAQNRNSGPPDNAESNESLKKIASEHGIQYCTLEDYHAPASIALLQSSNPDLGVVFGTNILKESVFGVPLKGSINLHSGLVPFYRGGPPVFWELFNGESELGLTVHWMAKKVDAGDVIIQAKVPLVYDFSFGLDFEEFIIHCRRQLTEKCAILVAEAVESIAKGNAPRVPQDPNVGNRYRLPTKKQKDELRRRLKKRRSDQVRRMDEVAQEAK